MMERFYNPVLVKELKLRFRSFKSFSGLMFYLAVLCIFIAGFLLLTTEFTGRGFFRPETSFMMFAVLTILQMALVLFITPSLTAGAISSEREKQTLNILLTTTQSSTQIVIGKLLSSVAFLVLMLVAGLPLYSLVFLFGGVSPSQLISIFLFYLVTVVAIGSIGVMFSTITKRTIVAMIATYGSIIFLGGITAFFFFLTMAFHQMGNAIGTSTSFMTYFWASINPGALMLTLISPEMGDALAELSGIELPVWIMYLIAYVLIIVLCLTIAIKKLRANMKSNR
ncbi:MAG TPA: ABC transporter permease [Lysinibacillus sp.]|jgi:ABC-2 type transport system permease protein|uniref:ABC transporter permease n=1 Tax=Lysinibacillus fusiformis TaxID=28031 RepID=A0A2I0V574_9BACI|nr:MULTISPECIES: ABC transporter permease [Lysinibacillus]HBT72730.1 ABC transporter permease [Lysinibacillus sp.]KUF36263.1 ABC transporter permease [Lysinibacillus sp. F5]MEE3806797.1 ABC transporter permease [Lysinibacillus fusiformis]PKU53477.1 ABC transporter permease [Lysinibacillus fusiformis]WCH48563.1 ABC transporter permease subunit [Lysinibacillus sp. OF-1]